MRDDPAARRLQKSFSIPTEHHEKLAKAKRLYEEFIGEPKTWGEFLVDMAKLALSAGNWKTEV